MPSSSGFWPDLRRAIRPPEPAPYCPVPITDVLRPDSFVRMAACEKSDDDMTAALTGEVPVDVESTEAGVRMIAHHIAIPTNLAVEWGLIDPPEGWEPPVWPKIPLRRRLRGFVSGQVYRVRIALANRLAGFDVEERD